MQGTLFVVATPIGNLSDITIRALETLKSADLIACEDTRHTNKLLAHHGIPKSLIRYDEHSHEKMSREIISLLEKGRNVALVTDAGTPVVSDPGSRLVRLVLDRGFKVVPIPGPSALTASLMGSGLGDAGVVFLGFLPRRTGRAKRMLQEGLGLGKTVAIFESPFRIKDTLELIETVDPAASIVVAREMTKIHEEFVRGGIKEVRLAMESRPEKGEAVILIEPAGHRQIETETN